MDETTGIIISSGAVGALCGVASTWIKAKFGQKVKAEIPQPCDVRKVNDCISVKECNRRMKELDERVTRLETRLDSGFATIMDKLSAMDRESEQRAVALHRRMDAMVSTVAKVDGEVSLIKAKMFKTR